MKARPAALVVLATLAVSALAAPADGRVDSGSASFEGVRIMPGGSIVGDRIEYEGGSVVVVPNGQGTESFDSCPAGYVCVFAGTNWTGNLVAFSSCCAWNNLSAYGFDNTTSSWRNRLSVDAQLAKDAGGGGAKLCLNNGSYAASMPAGWDNVTSSLRVRNAGSYC